MIDTSKFNTTKQPTGAVPSAGQQDPYASFTMPQQTFNAPGMDQWSRAADLYGYASTPTATPGAWDTGEAALNQMIGQKGMPIDVTGWWGAQQPQFQTQLSDQTRQMAEQAGLGGMRWSSPLAVGIADQTRRGLENLTADFAGRQIAANEAGMGRYMDATSGLFNVGQGRTGLDQANMARMMQGAGGLAGIGGLQFAAPMQAAQALQQSGNNMFNQQSNMMNQMYNPPWMQGALQASGQSAYGTPQTYQPSFGENMLGIAGQLLPYANFGGSPSGGYTPTTNPYMQPNVPNNMASTWTY